MHKHDFKGKNSIDDMLNACATIMGFIGMLRPHTFLQLEVNSLQLVKIDRGIVKAVDVAGYLASHAECNILGFFFEFKSKTMPHARAYFPNLSAPRSHYSAMCPVRALQCLAMSGLLIDKWFTKMTAGARLRKFLQGLTDSKNPVPLYTLRIGGRSWNISQGLDRQFVDYLGTWKSPEASARYYRDAPASVLRKLQKFYEGLPDPQTL